MTYSSGFPASRFLAALLVTTCLSGQAYAQAAKTDQNNNLVLSPIDVQAGGQLTHAEQTIEKAQEVIQRTPGGVAIVPSSAYRDQAVLTIKDVVDFTPGVFAQTKFAQDTRLSIRGSGLSRNFHLRGIKLYQDGIPFNTADGGGDFQEVDPMGALYTEVFKGANALKFGASVLGGAINFISPTGYDVDPIFGRLDGGSFGYRRAMIGSGMVIGKWDYFIQANWAKADGFRQQNEQDDRRLSANIGYKFNDNAETRFYINLNDLNAQIPGGLTKFQALNTPKLANILNLRNNYQRNIDSYRVGNKTTLRYDNVEINMGGYAIYKTLYHPIFQVVDNTNQDWGVFANIAHETDLKGHKNRFLAGVNFNGGTNSARRYVSIFGQRGAQTYVGQEFAANAELYGENQYFIKPDLAFVLGGQLAYADRSVTAQRGGPSGAKDFTSFNPKVGLLWQIDPTWQAFVNVSRSFEPPPLAELGTTFLPTNPADIKAQNAWTVEVGTRGQRDDYKWDLSLYHSQVRDELQFIDIGGGASRVQNADKTIHQGAELGFGVTVLKNIFPIGEAPDRLWLNAAYTYSDFTFDGDPLYGNNKIPGAPSHYLRAELMYKNPNGLYFGPDVEWVPEAYFVDNANTLKTKSYALLGFKAGYEWKNGLSIYVDARNLTDEKYISNANVTGTAALNSTLFVPGNGRSIYAGLRYKW